MGLIQKIDDYKAGNVKADVLDRRDFIKKSGAGLAYLLGASYGLTACGSDSSGSDNGNGNTPITTRREFKNLGWDVYDAKTDDLNSIVPNEGLNYPTPHDDFKTAYEANTNNIQSILSNDEKSLIEKLIDGSMNNDELFASFVTGTDRASVTIDTNDSNVGQNAGSTNRYVVRKQLSVANAEILRSISPSY